MKRRDRRMSKLTEVCRESVPKSRNSMVGRGGALKLIWINTIQYNKLSLLSLTDQFSQSTSLCPLFPLNSYHQYSQFLIPLPNPRSIIRSYHSELLSRIKM